MRTWFSRFRLRPPWAGPDRFAFTTRRTTSWSTRSTRAFRRGRRTGAGGPAAPYTPTPYRYTAAHPTNADTVPGTPSGAAAANARHVPADDHRRLQRRLSLLPGDRPRQRRDDLSASRSPAVRPDLLRPDRSRRPDVSPMAASAASSGTLGLDLHDEAAGRRRPTRPGVVVAADGSGDFNTVQGALDFVPDRSPRPRHDLRSQRRLRRDRLRAQQVATSPSSARIATRSPSSTPTTRSSIRIRRTSPPTSGPARSLAARGVHGRQLHRRCISSTSRSRPPPAARPRGCC